MSLAIWRTNKTYQSSEYVIYERLRWVNLRNGHVMMQVPTNLLLVVISIIEASILILIYRILLTIRDFGPSIDELTKAILDVSKTQSISPRPDTLPLTQAKASGGVKELPPEIVAPNLRKMQKTAGFGSSVGDQDSDT